MGANAIGAVLPPPTYLHRLHDHAIRHDRLLILDEIATAIGRTGRDFAFQHGDPFQPDLVCFSKGIGVGYVNVGAVAVHGRVADVVMRGRQALLGHTYNGNPIACAVGNAVLDQLDEQQLASRCAELGDFLLAELRAVARHRQGIRDVRGKGLLVAIDIGRGAERCAPEEQASLRIYTALLRRGMLSLPGSGSADGVLGDHVLLAPPFISTRTDLSLLVEAVDDAFREFDATRRLPA